MFSSKKRDEINCDQVDTFIGQGTEFKGTITARGTIKIEGRVEGEINAQGDVIVSETGGAKANIKARHVTVAGEVDGDLDLSGRLEITATGKVRGTIQVTNLAVSDGGFFLGTCEMRADGDGKKPVARSDAAGASPAAEASA